MDAISPTTLAGREGQPFTIGGVPAHLAKVTSSELAGGGGALHAHFATESPHGLEQDVRTVAHDDLADTDLLVVPSSPTELVVTFTWLDPPP